VNDNSIIHPAAVLFAAGAVLRPGFAVAASDNERQRTNHQVTLALPSHASPPGSGSSPSPKTAGKVGATISVLAGVHLCYIRCIRESTRQSAAVSLRTMFRCVKGLATANCHVVKTCPCSCFFYGLHACLQSSCSSGKMHHNSPMQTRHAIIPLKDLDHVLHR
jgi:hypothetical protein